MNKPMRTCIVCKQKFNKTDLIRIVNNDKTVLIEKNKKFDGRGAYICKDKKCHENLVKTKALNRAFKKEISLETYNDLLKNLD